MNWQDFLVAGVTLLDVLCGAVLAVALGYRLMPSALGLIAGGLGSVFTGNFTPVYFQQESMVQAAREKDLRARVTMILGAAVLTGIAGLLGWPQFIVDFIGPEIFAAVLCGVGLFLTGVAVWNLTWKMNRVVGFATIAAAVIVQLLTNDLIKAIAVSVPFGLILHWLLVRIGQAELTEIEAPIYTSWKEAVTKEFQFVKPVFHTRVLVGALNLATITIGANTAYAAVNASMTNGLNPGYNAVTVVSSVADFFSSLFGGPSMEVVISATAAAPHPVFSGALLMFTAAALILTGTLAYKVARRIHPSVMAGYLAVIGFILVAIPNGQAAYSMGNLIIIIPAAALAAIGKPFWGMVVGVILKMLLSLFGVL